MPNNIPTPAALYFALFISMILPTAFYCVYFMYPNPRWFIMWHALLAIAGVHGLTVILGRGRALALPLLLAWCVLQGARWHREWIERCTFIPKKTLGQMTVLPDYSLDVNLRKELVQQALDWMAANTRDPLILTGYPTTTAFTWTNAGYTGRPFVRTLDLGWATRGGAPEAALEALVLKNPETFIVQAPWDKSASYDKAIEPVSARHSGRVVFERSFGSGERIRILRLEGAAAAPAPAR